ncbi:MAG: hypothetical protein M0C28_04860 [Candidatus Moduliflexus flocculans]|nr:hypothetical protein [Candidatus Moduliflexus flocculans]
MVRLDKPDQSVDVLTPLFRLTDEPEGRREEKDDAQEHDPFAGYECHARTPFLHKSLRTDLRKDSSRQAQAENP